MRIELHAFDPLEASVAMRVTNGIFSGVRYLSPLTPVKSAQNTEGCSRWLILTSNTMPTTGPCLRTGL